ncbi:MAG: oxidoreductase [Sarcina sp.]
MKKKVVLITGASSGFGKAAAIKLHNEGYTVYAVARRVSLMEDLERLGIRVEYMDVTDELSIEHVIDKIIIKDKTIDVLINNAGYGSYGAIETVPMDLAKRQFDVNVFGLACVSNAVIPYMRRQKSGLIVNISSVVGKVALPFMGWYSASKHAVEGLSDAMRLELEPFGIKVVIVEPGVVRTGFDSIVADNFNENENEAYQEASNSFKNSFIKMYANPKAPDSEVVADELVKIVNSPNPKIRYRPTKDAKLNLKVRKIVSDKTFDKLLKSQTK